MLHDCRVPRWSLCTRTICILPQVDDKESKVHLGDRSIVLVLDKKDKEQEYWPRLLKATGKAPAWLKVREELRVVISAHTIATTGRLEQVG